MSERKATGAPLVTPEDLLSKMRAGVKMHHEIRMRDLVVPVRVLSIDEMNAVRRESVRMAIASGDEVDKNVSIQKLTLQVASTPIGGGALLNEKFFKQITLDELAYLYEEYIKVLDDVNPGAETLTTEQVRELVGVVKKNTCSAKDCSLVQLKVIFSLFQDLIRKQETQGSPKDN